MAPIVPTLRYERRLWNEGARAGRRRRRGRRRTDLRRRRRRRRHHAAGLPPHPRRPRLEDAVRGPARAARAAHPRAGGRRRRRRRVGPRDRPAQHLSRHPPRHAPRDRAASAGTTTCSSTATGSPASRPHVGPYTAIVDGDAKVLHDRLRLGRGQGRPRPDDGRCSPRAIPGYGWEHNQGYATLRAPRWRSAGSA